MAVDTRTIFSQAIRSEPTRPILTDVVESARAAAELAAGGVVGHGFGNFYAITARADQASVARVNAMKGRPVDQVGSVTVPPSRIPEQFDWTALPPGLSRRAVLTVMDTFFGLGPFGFRGPAAAHLPAHMTSRDGAALTTQVIAPGYACPANDFLTRGLDATGDDLLYTTSANRSRHLTGADDTPAHWRADGLRAEFAHEPAFRLLEHPDEDAARAGYPLHLPMSTTILGFHRLGTNPSDPRMIQFVLERHGSLHVDVVRNVLDRFGFGLEIGPRARTRLRLREYPPA